MSNDIKSFSFIDEALDKLEVGERKEVTPGTNPYNPPTIIFVDKKDEAKQALIQGFKAAMLEVIGEDQEKKVEDWECPCGTNHHLETSYHNRNELRSEQRTKLDQLSKER